MHLLSLTLETPLKCQPESDSIAKAYNMNQVGFTPAIQGWFNT